MAVTLADVRDSIEIESDSSTDDAIERMLGTADALVERYAPDAPDGVKDEAIIRCLGWLANTPSPSLMGGVSVGVKRTFDTSQFSALRHSGAMALLSPWKVRRAGVI